MLSMDQMKVDSWTLYAIRQRTLLLLCLSLLLLVTKFLSLMRQTTQHQMSNYFFVQVSKSSRKTVGSSSLVISKTRLLNRYIAEQQSLNLTSVGKLNKSWQRLSSIVAKISSNARRSPTHLELWQRSFKNTSLTSEEPSTSCNDTQALGLLTLAFWRR